MGVGSLDRVIVALDTTNFKEAECLADKLAACGIRSVKVGLGLTAAAGTPAVVNAMQARGFHVMLDLKLHDIPHQVGLAAASAAGLAVWGFTMHASAGVEAMKAAVAHSGNSHVIAVTVLTSLGEEECRQIYGSGPAAKARQFATTSRQAGATAIVCSPQELAAVGDVAPGLLRITPGVRPIWAAAKDQKRVMTPGQAIRDGADYLVIGRPITDPPPEVGTPEQAISLINDEITAALAE